MDGQKTRKYTPKITRLKMLSLFVSLKIGFSGCLRGLFLTLERFLNGILNALTPPYALGCIKAKKRATMACNAVFMGILRGICRKFSAL